MRQYESCLSAKDPRESYSLSVYQPCKGSVEIQITEELEYALRQLRREQRRGDKKEQNHCRRLETVPKRLIPEKAYPKSPEVLLIERYDCSIVWRSIQHLSSMQRRRLLMRHYFDIPTKEIAAIENCSVRAVEYCLRRAKKRIRAILKELRLAELNQDLS